jgi:hypothetical protein
MDTAWTQHKSSGTGLGNLRRQKKLWRAWRQTARDLRLARLEREVAALRQSHAALERVYRSSGDEQRARAERGQSGCQACAQNEGISRRCMSPGTEGARTEDMEGYNYGHAIVVGEHGTRFCRTCRGEASDRHAPAWCGVLEPLRCRELGAKRPARQCFDEEGCATSLLFRPIPCGGDLMPACAAAGAGDGP